MPYCIHFLTVKLLISGLKKPSHVQLCIRFLYWAAETNGLLISLGTSTLSLLSPCQPILLTSLLCSGNGEILNTKCQNTLTYTTQLFLATLEFVAMQHLMTGLVYYTGTVMMQGITFLWQSGEAFERKARSNASFVELIKSYEKLKVYEKLLNSCIRSRIFLVTALVVPSLQILLSCTGIHSLHSDDTNKIQAILFLWTYIVILVFSILLFSAAGRINESSQKWIAECKRRCRNRVEKRRQMSLVLLRLEFGNNFVEPLTPLVVQEFCVRQTVSFLLLRS